jgi:hypothetical protein
MTDIERLYEEIEDSGVVIINFCKRHKAMAVCDADGYCSIGIDENKIKSQAEHKSILLHERGHCSTHTFYNQSTPVEMRGKLERRADRYVAENDITKFMIHKAHIDDGLTEAWEFAEHFGVTVEYMKRILNIHFQMEFLE